MDFWQRVINEFRYHFGFGNVKSAFIRKKWKNEYERGKTK